MLKKENRLSTNFEFNITRKYGTKVNSRFCSIFYLKPRNYTGPVKVGFVVSNKTEKIAVKRNRIKRVFREAVRANLEKLPSDLWLVVHPKKESMEKTYEEVRPDVDQVLSKISIS